MPTVALQITISDYAKWRPVFDKHRSLRAKAGFKNERVYQNVDDPNEVIIWGEASRKVARSKSLRRPSGLSMRAYRPPIRGAKRHTSRTAHRLEKCRFN